MLLCATGALLPVQAAIAAPEVRQPETGGEEITEVRAKITGFHILNATLFSEAELNTLLADFVGRDLRFADLQQALKVIGEHYRKAGYLVHPVLPEQDLSAGLVTIRVAEGRLGMLAIDTDGKVVRTKTRFASSVVTSDLKQGELLNLHALDRGTRLLNDMPGIGASSVLMPGGNEGETDVALKLSDKPLIDGNVRADNEGVLTNSSLPLRTSGDLRLSASLNVNNLNGLGDQLQIAAASFPGASFWKLAFSSPATVQGWRAGAFSSGMSYDLQTIYSGKKADGNASSFGVFASSSFIRSRTHNRQFSVNYDVRQFQNSFAGMALSNKSIVALGAVLNEDYADGLAGGGTTRWGIGITAGQLDLSADAADFSADQLTIRSNGAYNKLNWNVSRDQRVTENSSVWLALSGQFADKNLDNAEKFAVGGANGVRAYPIGEGNGDEGGLLSVESRHILQPDVQFIVFYDHAHTRINKMRYELKGAGIGLNLTGPDDFIVRGMIASRIGDNPASNMQGNDSDGTLSRLRLWLSATKLF